MSILNVDQISPIGSGSTITVTATETKTGDITIGTGTSIFSPAGNTLVLGTNNVERIRIKNDGKVGVGTNNPTAKLEIKGSDNPLVKIVQDTSGIARLNLESATNDGYQYSGIGLGDGTNDAELMWTTGGFDVNVGNSVRLRINSNGAWGAGTNFGSAGQVLTSQGSGSPVQWATPAAGWVHGTETALNGNVTLIKNGVPDGASHIRYLFRYVSTNSSAQPYVQVEYNNNGTIKNSNYQTCSTMVRGQGGISGDSDKTDGLQLWYSYTNPGNILHGVLDIYRIGTSGTDGTNMYMSFHGMGNSSSTGYDATFSAQGYFEIGTGSTDYVSGIKISTQNGSVQFDNGYIQQSYLLS